MKLSGLESLVMQWEGDIPKENWHRFKQHVKFMFTGPLNSRTEEKYSYLLIWVGPEKKGSTTRVLTFPTMTASLYHGHFESQVSPKEILFSSMFKFHRRVQDSSETEEEIVTALQIIAHDCDFKDPEEMIRHRIVFGTNLFKVRKKLILKGTKLTLDKAVETAR